MGWHKQAWNVYSLDGPLDPLLAILAVAGSGRSKPAGGSDGCPLQILIQLLEKCCRAACSATRPWSALPHVPQAAPNVAAALGPASHERQSNSPVRAGLIKAVLHISAVARRVDDLSHRRGAGASLPSGTLCSTARKLAAKSACPKSSSMALTTP